MVEVDGGEEPGFAPPVARAIGSDGKLVLGPFGVAVVTQITE